MIYFISNGKYTKIGRTSNIDDTLNKLQEGSATLLSCTHTLNGSIETESKLNFIFNAYRILGTWFDLPKKHLHITEELLDELYKNSFAQRKELRINETERLPVGMVYVNPEIANMHGITKALLIDHLFTLNPHNNEAKINVTELSTVLPISLSTAQRSIKELVEEQQYLIKHSRSIYSFSTKFFDAFPEYNNKIII